MKQKIKSTICIIIGLMFIASNHALAKKRESSNTNATDNNYEKLLILDKRTPFKYEGNPTFDFAYGTAALRAHHPDVAIFALERAVIENPHNQQAIIELGQAYLQINDINDAETTFKRLLNQPTNAQTKALANRYLAEIQKIRDKARTKKYLLLTVIPGYDSDINSVTSASGVPLPNGGILVLSPSQRGIASYYANEAINAGVYHRVNADSPLTLFALGGFYGLHNFKTNDFNYYLSDAAVGMSSKVGKWDISFPIRIRQYTFEEAPRRSLLDVSVFTGRKITDTQRISFGVTGEKIMVKQAKGSGSVVILDGGWIYKPKSTPLNIYTNLALGVGNPDIAASGFVFNTNFYEAVLKAEWVGIANQKPFISLEYVHG